ncbi:MAG: FxsA family protein [Planctomycetales bacterium]|nr:FxsA family protein [Planctomycetales bacterium]
MFLALVLLFTVIPLVELTILLRLGSALGFLPALGLVLGTGVLGAALARWQGLRAAIRVQEQLSQGKVPATELVDGLFILAAGLLLITPGALTDLTGLALLIPPVRGVIRIAATRWMQSRVRLETAQFRQGAARHASGDVIEAEVIDARTYEAD